MKSHKVARTMPALLLAATIASLQASPAAAQYGGIVSGAGAINRSMAGASTAAPLSAAGALYWNPATLTGLDRSELEVGAELLFVHTQADSQYNAGSLGPGIPPADLAGSTRSDTGVSPLPTMALAYKPEDSILSYGLGVFAIAGFGVDYAGSSTNPILTAPPPAGVGLGPVFSGLEVLQIHPAISLQLTDRLSIGMGPTVDLAKFRLDPFLVAAPDNANGDAFFTYPPGAHDSTTWGAGFDVGAYYQGDLWSLGASFKSPQWMDTFGLNSSDELGNPRRLSYGMDMPLIISLGGSYTAIEHWLFAADIRYIDYGNTRGLGDSGFAPSGAVYGPGWRSIFAIALGGQYQWNDALSMRLGYSWNQNPVPDSQSTINIVAPVVMQHTITAGTSWALTEDLSLSLAYLHGFANSLSGPLLTPAGPVPGATVGSTTSYDSVVLGANLKFGAPRR